MQYDDKLITLDNLGTFKGKMEGEIDKASHALIADEYDATKTYNVGDVVLHDGFLYECNTAIAQAEEWDPTKWTQVKVTELGGNGGVIEVEDYASLPTVGEAGIIYITKDDNKQYRWDGNGYVELGGEDEIEIVNYQSTTPLTDEQMHKASEGKLVIVIDSRNMHFLCDFNDTRFVFRYVGYNSSEDTSGSNVPYSARIMVSTVTLNRQTKIMSYDGNINCRSISSTSNSNFFASNVEPAVSGKRVVREMNLRKTHDMITPNVFDITATYAVGDVVIYQNQLYQCHTAVETAGAWTGDTNWTLTNLVDYIKATEQIGAKIVEILDSEINTIVSESRGAEIEGADLVVNNGKYYVRGATWSGSMLEFHCFWQDSSAQINRRVITYNSASRNVTRNEYTDRLTLQSKIGVDFSSTGNYVVGDLVWHNNNLYRCIVAHSGTWDASHFQQTTVSDAIQAGSSGGVIEVDDYASLPSAGEVGTIYITKDTNRQYRWTGTAYVELSAEDEVEVVDFYDGNVINLTEAQLKKLYEGKLSFRHPGLGMLYSFTFIDTTSNKAYFRGFYTSSQSGSYVDQTKSAGIGSVSYDLGTKVVTRTSSSATGIGDDSRNFFASNVDPVADGKRIVREMNVVGKLIPTYSSSDAGKVVKINSSGTGVELDDINVETATELEVNRLFRTEYTITSTITNGSASGDESIWTKETASVTIVPSSGYVLPETITVSGATSSYDNSTGVVSLSAATGAVTIAGECTPETPVDMPSKGDIITLDNGTARYRVLKTNGNVAEVMALDDVTNSVFNGSSVTTTFSNGSKGQKYENSTLDSYMNSTFYNSLSANIKAAIVQKAVIQSIYQFGSSEISGYDFAITRLDSSTRWYKRKGQVSVGNRYCYALDLDDVAEYLGAGSGNTVSGADINDMFFEQTTSVGKSVWLSSASSDGSDFAFFVRGYGGFVFDNIYGNSFVVRPAFQVDLSQVTWEKEIPVPEKGDIITLDNGTARYRVLKINGNVAEVLALDDVADSAFNSSSITTTFSDGSVGQKYENSTLDSYMNSTFYNSLSANIKAAIVQKAVIQSIYQFGSSEISGYDFAMTRITSGTRWYKRKGQVSVGNRYCYALDLDDVAEYLGAGSGNTVSGADLNDMFFEQTASINKDVWLDSASSDFSIDAFLVGGGGGFVYYYYYLTSSVVRPAFQVDLSNLAWSK